MAYVKPNGPIGVNPSLNQDRMPVISVINGDSWTVDADLWDPNTMEPATVQNTKAEFLLVENRFACEPYWRGTWFNGIVPDDVVPGLVHIRVPNNVTGELRRGSYQFSVKVTSAVGGISETELVGYFKVEYEPTSDTHNIPYRREECQHKEQKDGKQQNQTTVARSASSGRTCSPARCLNRQTHRQ